MDGVWRRSTAQPARALGPPSARASRAEPARRRTAMATGAAVRLLGAINSKTTKHVSGVQCPSMHHSSVAHVAGSPLQGAAPHCRWWLADAARSCASTAACLHRCDTLHGVLVCLVAVGIGRRVAWCVRSLPRLASARLSALSNGPWAACDAMRCAALVCVRVSAQCRLRSGCSVSTPQRPTSSAPLLCTLRRLCTSAVSLYASLRTTQSAKQKAKQTDSQKRMALISGTSNNTHMSHT